MPDMGLGWSELLVLAVIAIVVVGPKDLPVLLRTLGRFTAKARAAMREFQDSFEEIARESGIDEVRKDLEQTIHPPELPYEILDVAAAPAHSPRTEEDTSSAARAASDRVAHDA